MKFAITRASTPGEDTATAPCREAVRDVDRWIIDINSIEQLMELSTKYGDLIVSSAGKEITIYDDWVE